MSGVLPHLPRGSPLVLKLADQHQRPVVGDSAGAHGREIAALGREHAQLKENDAIAWASELTLRVTGRRSANLDSIRVQAVRLLGTVLDRCVHRGDDPSKINCSGDTVVVGPYATFDIGDGQAADLFLLRYDENGALLSPDHEHQVKEALAAPTNGAAGISDVFIFSHGWNNTFDVAASRYRDFIEGYTKQRQSLGIAKPAAYRPLLRRERAAHALRQRGG